MLGYLPNLGQAKIKHLYQAIFRDHDIARLQVAMDDPCGMGFRQRIRYLYRVADRI